MTGDWSNNVDPVIGDWGFDPPGYPKGLYLHGVTMPEGHFPANPLPNPIIYDNDEYADILDDDVLCAMASLGKITLPPRSSPRSIPRGCSAKAGKTPPSGITTAGAGIEGTRPGILGGTRGGRRDGEGRPIRCQVMFSTAVTRIKARPGVPLLPIARLTAVCPRRT
jgi:hypothetical protein